MVLKGIPVPQFTPSAFSNVTSVASALRYLNNRIDNIDGLTIEEISGIYATIAQVVQLEQTTINTVNNLITVDNNFEARIAALENAAGTTPNPPVIPPEIENIPVITITPAPLPTTLERQFIYNYTILWDDLFDVTITNTSNTTVNVKAQIKSENNIFFINIPTSFTFSVRPYYNYFYMYTSTMYDNNGETLEKWLARKSGITGTYTPNTNGQQFGRIPYDLASGILATKTGYVAGNYPAVLSRDSNVLGININYSISTNNNTFSYYSGNNPENNIRVSTSILS